MKHLLCILAFLAALSSSAAVTNAPANVTLAWDKSPGTNVIVNYKVYYGVASATYTNSVSSGTNLTVTVSSLVRGVTYWFSATATDNQNLESDYSTEVSYRVPTPPPPPVTLRVVSQ